MKAKSQLIEMTVTTADGEFIARYSGQGLAELDFPKVGRETQRPVTDRRHGGESQNSALRAPPHRRLQDKIRGWHRVTADALKLVLGGRKPKTLPPLDMKGTMFQKCVWNALKKITPGKTRSYGEIARVIGRPKAVRAVGSACGANPVPVLVPCHRVLSAGKALGGFSGGLDWKRALLRREGIKL